MRVIRLTTPGSNVLHVSLLLLIYLLFLMLLCLLMLLLLLPTQLPCVLMLFPLQLMFLIFLCSNVCIFLSLRLACTTRVVAACTTHRTQPARVCTLPSLLHTKYVDCATDQHRGWIAPIQLRLSPEANQTSLQVPFPLFALNMSKKGSHRGRLFARWKLEVKLCAILPTVAPLGYVTNEWAVTEANCYSGQRGADHMFGS